MKIAKTLINGLKYWGKKRMNMWVEKKSLNETIKVRAGIYVKESAANNVFVVVQNDKLRIKNQMKLIIFQLNKMNSFQHIKYKAALSIETYIANHKS